MIFGVPYTVFWSAAVIIFGIIEAATLGIFTIWFALGAVAALIFAAIGFSIEVQIIVFIVISAVLLYFTAPFVKKYLKVGSHRTNADLLIGETGIVIQEIDVINGLGQVKTRGQIWSAVSDDGNNIEEGKRVKVIRIEGVKLVVKEYLDKGGESK